MAVIAITFWKQYPNVIPPGHNQYQLVSFWGFIRCIFCRLTFLVYTSTCPKMSSVAKNSFCRCKNCHINLGKGQVRVNDKKLILVYFSTHTSIVFNRCYIPIRQRTDVDSLFVEHIDSKLSSNSVTTEGKMPQYYTWCKADVQGTL